MTGYRCTRNSSGNGSGTDSGNSSGAGSGSGTSSGTATGKVFLHRPSRAKCPQGEIEAIELTGRGTVYSHTTLHAAAEPFEKDLPFQMAIIELAEGPRLTARIEGEPVAIGDSVQAAREADGVWFFTK